MKKVSVFLFLLLFSAEVFGQTSLLSKDEYLQKNKNQKTAAWVLLAGGTTLIVLGAAIGGQDDRDDLGYGSNFDTGMWLFGTGIIADLVSIPLFVSASKNAKKAATISFTNPRVSFPQPHHALKFQPTITLTIHL